MMTAAQKMPFWEAGPLGLAPDGFAGMQTQGITAPAFACAPISVNGNDATITNLSSFRQLGRDIMGKSPDKDVPMVSTYLSYNSVVRNFRQTMTRVAQQPDVARNAAYYRDNIGKVKTVDDLLKDHRLYQYAMKAYGLEDMTYAKAFMKKVLESDLSEANSFANKLTDKRYREFAAAFSFNGTDTPVAQSADQTDEMIGLYSATVKRQVEAIDEDTRYYNLTIAGVKTVDEFLNDDRLRTYVFQALGIDDSQWSRDTIGKVLGSEPTDPNSYVNTVWVSRLDDINAQLAQAQANLNDASTKISTYTAQLSQPGADMNDLRAKITLEKAHYEKSAGDMKSHNDAITMIGRYVDLAGAFEFSPDGTLPSGVSAQTDANRTTMNTLFVNSKGAVYLAAEEEYETLAIKLFRSNIYFTSSIDAFVSTPNVYNFALKAVGISSKTWKRSRGIQIRASASPCISSERLEASRPHTTSWPTRLFRRYFGPFSTCPTRSAPWRSTSKPRSWKNISN